MDKQILLELENLLNGAASGLKKVSSKKMFGCYALWAGENVFALVWKHGRIGVKLPETAKQESLMSVAGAEPWKAGPMTMSHWILVPETFHSKTGDLKKWVHEAHGLCLALSVKPAKPLKPTKLLSKMGAKNRTATKGRSKKGRSGTRH